jgi:hypothetical protein
MTPQFLLNHWASCEYEFSCFLEKRETDTFRRNDDPSLLSAFRTDIAQDLLNKNTGRVLLEGKG